MSAKRLISRRMFLRGSVLVAATATAAACASPTAAPAPPAAKPTEAAKAPAAPAATTAPAVQAPAATKAAEPAKAVAAGQFKESPMLAELVKAGKLPPVEQRLPKEPKIANEMPATQMKTEVGTYGGTLRTVTSVAPDWDADVFVMGNEPIINTPGILGEEITPNIFKEYKVSDDQKVFTFNMRQGLKWSDGNPVTTADVRFAFEDFVFNTELTPNPPNWLRAGNKPTGALVKLDVVDDFTFKLTFEEPYGGLLPVLAIQGWRGHDLLIKPAHFLKQFHKKYADAGKLDAAIKENKVDNWVGLFTLKNCINTDLTRKKAIGYPALVPWLIKEVTPQQLLFERNPYYFKVDAAGNQLPYIDKIASQMVPDIEMVAMKHISGEVDFARESATLVKMPLYKENEKKANIRAIMARTHVTYTDVFLNWTFKDDNWRKVVWNLKFRQALNYAIDRKEIVDAVYYGYAEPGTILDNTYDPKKAEALLDEIGMKKGADGFRLGPDGKVFEIPFECGAHSPDQLPVEELFVQFWTKIGLKTTLKRIDSQLWTQRINANEMKATSIWTHTPLWYMGDWGWNNWGRAFNLWWLSNGKDGEEPPAEVKKLYEGNAKVSALPPAEGRKQFEEMKKMMRENIFYFIHIERQMQPLLVNAKLGNVSDSKDAFAIATNFGGEQFYFKA